MRQVKEKIINAVFPLICPVCRKIPERGNICPECEKKLIFLKEPFCVICGKPISDGQKDLCSNCEKRERNFQQARSVFLYQGSVKKAVLDMKYGNKREFAAFFADQMIQKYERQIDSWQAAFLVPVPLSREKYRKRGYNQALLLAEALSKRLKIPVHTKLVARTRNTRPLSGKNPAQRRAELVNAFGIYRQEKFPERVILVDDIYTTGSTADEISRLLKLAGVKKVYLLTICAGKDF